MLSACLLFRKYISTEIGSAVIIKSKIEKNKRSPAVPG
jgi:hypothetical protein